MIGLTAWLQHNAHQPHRPPLETVDLDGIEVLEGEAAAESHRIWLERQQRDDLERALRLLP